MRKVFLLLFVCVVSELSAQNNGVEEAHLHSGADAGAKIAACITALPSTGGICNALGLEGVQSATVNPFAGITKPFTLLLCNATISTTALWELTGTNQKVTGCGNSTVIKYTGVPAAAVLSVNGAAHSNGSLVHVAKLVLDGNGLATDGLLMKDTAGSLFDHITVINVSGAGFHARAGSGPGIGCVLCNFVDPTVSANVKGLTITTISSRGMEFDAGSSSANVIINPRFEGITGGTGVGIYDNSQYNQYYGGTSEGNDVGIHIPPAGVGAKFHGTALEANAQDVVVDGDKTEFYGIYATSAQANNVRIRTGADHTSIFGGEYNAVTVDSGANYTDIFGPYISTSLNDSGTQTQTSNVFSAGTGYYANSGFPDVQINNLSPRLKFRDGDGAADQKLWDVIADGMSLSVRTRTDADAVGQSALTISRTETAVVGISVESNPIINAKSISGTSTVSNNLRGSCTFASAATCTVIFGVAEANTTYFITLGGNANETFWWSARGTGGFTLNSSNANSTATVDWHFIR